MSCSFDVNLNLPACCYRRINNNMPGLQGLWGDLERHPHCSHGPAVLFSRDVGDKSEKFYVCAAYRCRRLCRFYLKDGQKMSNAQKNEWQKEKEELLRRYPHKKLHKRFNEIKAEPVRRRCYCHSCEKLILISEKDQHTDHEVTKNLTDHQLHHPTELLKPSTYEKKEAQYLFSKKSIKDIINMLLQLGAKQVLCIGTPRIHEYISEHHSDKMSSLLLDIDGRFHNFFGPLEYCWYNLFNHHFFHKNAIKVFNNFITQNEGKDTYLICDPPFGGRVEFISHTMKTISDLHKKLNNNNDDSFFLKIMFIFPYFMESVMKEKSNPPSVAGGLKNLKMSDYKVDYDNHPLFVTKEEHKKGSLVRIFTNISLKLLKLPASDGYRYCKACERWVYNENKHCKECKKCSSKDGTTYKHCKICKRCVKPTWKHCKMCDRCASETHACGIFDIVGRCFVCNELGHMQKNCPSVSFVETTNNINVKGEKMSKKRKTESELKTSLIKKGKIEDTKKKAKQKIVPQKKKKLRNLKRTVRV